MAIPRGLIRKMADDNAIYSLGLTLSYKSFPCEIKATQFKSLYQVKANFDEDCSQVFLELDNENEHFEKLSCTCGHFQKNKTICPHLVAVLIKIENDFFPNNCIYSSKQSTLQAKTDEACLSLLNYRAKMIKTRAQYRAGHEKALLIPFLHLTKDHVKLSFKAGCHKAYTVKDLDIFYQSLLNRTTASCGKNEHFLYAPENFQEPEMVRFFLTYYTLCVDAGNKKFMRLTPEALDHFFALYRDTKISCDSRIINIINENPICKMYIRKSGSVYYMNMDDRDFTIYNGADKVYIVKDDTLYTCDEHFTDACSGLLQRFSRSESIPIVTEKDMPIFYNIVLKPASRFIVIKTKDFVFDLPALKTKIYIESDSKKKVVAKVEFHYGDTVFLAFNPERNLQTILDIEQETKIENLVKQYFPVNSEVGMSICPFDDDALFTLVYEGIPALSHVASLYMSADIKSVKLNTFPKAQMAVRMESNLLDLDISAGHLSTAELASALSAYNEKKKYIRLKDGSFLLLESSSMERFAHVANGIGLTGSDIKKDRIELPLFRSLYLDSVTELEVLKDSKFQEFAHAFSVMNSSQHALPDTLYGILRDYQKYGFNWLYTLASCGFGGILADDMGLGKTLQILSLLLAFKNENRNYKTLVVCPASLVLNWENEIHHFTPSLKAICMIGTTEERAKIFESLCDYDVIITSYELLKRDISLYQAHSFDFEIIDEAQYIKNHNTQNARVVKSIHASVRFALTGTPIENTIAELWSIFDFLMPGYLYKYARFRQLFEVPLIKDGDTSVLSEIKRMTSPFILRRLKKEVLTELPEKSESVLYTKLAPEQEKIYHATLLSMQKELDDYFVSGTAEKSKIMVLAMLTKLRQICCDPSLLYNNYKEESAKHELCMDLIINSINSGHKVLVFSQFTSMLSILQKGLNKKKIPFYLIQGSTKKEDRIALVNAFNNDDTPVFLISLKAGGTGLNLTGADVVIHYDPWWNLSAQNQATDRAHRIGQNRNVTVYKLIAKGTIEEKILQLAEKKQRLADQILPDEGSILQGLTKEKILELFQY